jgi:hypothetical protein
MEPHERTEMVDVLLAEAKQHLEILESSIAAQDIAQQTAESQHTGQSMSHPQVKHVLQQERRWWEETSQKLTEVRDALAHIEQSEQQRGVRM